MQDNDRGTRSLVAAARLREMIVSGAIAPGQRISERALGEQLEGLSRTPLREAFKILEAEGLVTIAPNRGAVVTALSLADVAGALEVLTGLESMAAGLACERISAAQLGEIEVLHERMKQAHRDELLMEYFHLNQAIHQRIVDAAGNSRLSRIYAAECARIRRYRYAGNRRHERWDRAVAEHDHILEALKQRDGALLREVLRAHHSSGWQVSRMLLAAELEGGGSKRPPEQDMQAHGERSPTPRRAGAARAPGG